jgi:hypothetical protein
MLPEKEGIISQRSGRLGKRRIKNGSSQMRFVLPYLGITEKGYIFQILPAELKTTKTVGY